MTVSEYKVLADFYPGEPGRLTKEIQRLMEEGWELLGDPGGVRTATLNYGTLAPEELGIYPTYRDMLFYAVMVKYEEVTYD